jgi:hypothetical protein
MSNAEGVFAMIDPEDYEKVSAFGKWYRNTGGYAVKKTRIKGRNISIRMHALINNTPKGLHTDHVSGDKLDNRKINLRTVSAEMNSWNRHRDKPHHRYPNLPKGVSFDINRNQYVATKTIRRRFNGMKEAMDFVDSGVDEL